MTRGTMHTDDLSIRRARPDEAAALTDLALAAKSHWAYPAEWLALWRDDLTFTPDYVARRPVFVAERGGELVGVYALVGPSETPEIDHFWIRPAAMGQGVGGRLFAHLAEQARAGGARLLEIASDPHAEGFYRKMGARRVGDVPSRPAGRTLPLLHLDLRPAK